MNASYQRLVSGVLTVSSLAINVWVFGDSIDKENDWMTEQQQDVLNFIQLLLGLVQLYLFFRSTR